VVFLTPLIPKDLTPFCFLQGTVNLPLKYGWLPLQYGGSSFGVRSTFLWSTVGRAFSPVWGRQTPPDGTIPAGLWPWRRFGTDFPAVR